MKSNSLSIENLSIRLKTGSPFRDGWQFQGPSQHRILHYWRINLLFIISETDQRHCQQNLFNSLTNLLSLIVDFPKIPRDNINRSHNKISSKKVCFSPTSTLHQYYRSGTDNEEGGAVSTWYKKSDYKQFRRGVKEEVLSLRQEKQQQQQYEDNSADDMCHTGIEHLVCQRTLLKIMQLRELHKNAVLDEHERQVNDGTDNLHALHAISKAHSKWARSRAYDCAGGQEMARRWSSPSVA